MLIRFGRWDELIAEPIPADEALYCSTTATVHYGRGVAHAAKGHLAQAEAERDAFAAAYATIPESRYLFNNTSRDILAVAAALLDGEIAHRKGAFDEAFDHLRRAVALDDALPYDEPWGWMQPTRHAMGALLLEQAHGCSNITAPRRENIDGTTTGVYPNRREIRGNQCRVGSGAGSDGSWPAPR